jgi:hypothetical protein
MIRVTFSEPFADQSPIMENVLRYAAINGKVVIRTNARTLEPGNQVLVEDKPTYHVLGLATPLDFMLQCQELGIVVSEAGVEKDWDKFYFAEVWE